MTRSLTTAIKNELATNDLRPIHLITIGFSSPVNITDCSFPLTSSVSGSSVTYASSSFVMGISNFSEEVDITKTTLNLGLSGADQTFISTALNENVVNDSVTIHRGFLDDSNALIADPFLLYKGTIDTFKYLKKVQIVILYLRSYLIGQTLINLMVEKQTIHLSKGFLVQMWVWIFQVKLFKI